MALAARHRRTCQLVDPDHPDHNPAFIPIVEGWRPPDKEPSPSAHVPPSLTTKALGFGAALVSHVAAGMQTLDDDETEARLAVCRSCERFRGGECSICGCNLKRKARWAEQQCPEDRWPKCAEGSPRDDFPASLR